MYSSTTISLFPDNHYDWKPRLRFFAVPSWNGIDIIPVADNDCETLDRISRWYPSCVELSGQAEAARLVKADQDQAFGYRWFYCAASLFVDDDIDFYELAIDAADALLINCENQTFAEWVENLEDEHVERLAARLLHEGVAV